MISSSDFFCIYSRQYIKKTPFVFAEGELALLKFKYIQETQVTLVWGLAQLFLVEVLFLDSRIILSSHNLT
jgi:hypothetical protein